MHIRAAVASDGSRVVDFLRAEGYAHAQETADSWFRPKWTVLLAEDEHELIGVLILDLSARHYASDEPYVWVQQLLVATARRGAGVGTALIGQGMARVDAGCRLAAVALATTGPPESKETRSSFFLGLGFADGGFEEQPEILTATIERVQRACLGRFAETDS